jgi:DnaJ-domain-containing protein 1
MGSFDLSYDAEEDVLKITFAPCDARSTRAVALNDNILLLADPDLRSVRGLTFYSYARLLDVSETEFTALREMSEDQAEAALALLSVPPASRFFDLTDPPGLIARVLSPGLETLVGEEEIVL